MADKFSGLVELIRDLSYANLNPIEIANEFYRFLTLKEETINTFSSELLHDVWLVVLRDTKLYASICHQIAGRIIHHDNLKLETDEFDKIYFGTFELYKDTFGNYPTNSLIWPIPKLTKRPKNWTLTIKRLTDSNFEINGVDQWSTGLEIKHAIQKIGNIPADQQNLIYAGHKIQSYDYLHKYQFKNFNSIYVVLRLRGC